MIADLTKKVIDMMQGNVTPQVHAKATEDELVADKAGVDAGKWHL